MPKAASMHITYSHECDYPVFEKSVRAAFTRATASGEPLFCTDAEGLNDLYLDNLPFDRQTHNCSACRHFINRYGGLVRITEKGKLEPVMWVPDAVPDYYRASVQALAEAVRKARITRPFLTNSSTLGEPHTGGWSHLAVTGAKTFRHLLLSANQAAAAKVQDFETVRDALLYFSPKLLDDALHLLKAETLSRSEKFISPLQWLRDLYDRPKSPRQVRDNLLWKAVATAPEGYCHPRSAVTASLMEDIRAGLPFNAVKRNFEAKVGPLSYQRPKAAPAAGNIARAEEIVVKMAIAPSLERRFARLDEVQAIWRPSPNKAASIYDIEPGVFSHIRPKGHQPTPPYFPLPAQAMTWAKFQREVLPHAAAIEFKVHSLDHFIAMTTAVNADAPLIFKWDNPFAWYVYPGGSPATKWGLRTGWTPVTAIIPLPTMWGSNPAPFLGEGMVLALEGCADHKESGNALFPECLRSELHEIRSTIEAYSRRASISGRDGALASGFDLRKSGAIRCELRVMSNGRWMEYKIDRWD